MILSFLIAAVCTIRVLSVEPNSVSGMLHYPEDFSLPPDAITTLTLTDVSPAQDGNSAMIARQDIHLPQGYSVPFKLIYNPNKISDRHLYTIQARVTSSGRVVLSNASAYLVITQGNPTVVEVYVVPRAWFKDR